MILLCFFYVSPKVVILNFSWPFSQKPSNNLFQLHAISCSLKAVGTSDAVVGITTCRLACGGHGYMNSSNLPNIYSISTAAETYEGENTVMLLQAAR